MTVFMSVPFSLIVECLVSLIDLSCSQSIVLAKLTITSDKSVYYSVNFAIEAQFQSE